MPPPARLTFRKLPMVLMYHAVADTMVAPNKLSVLPNRFAGQMAWLAAHGLHGAAGIEIGSRDAALRMTVKKYLFQGYVAYQGRRQ
jgi:hypothetical protein